MAIQQLIESPAELRRLCREGRFTGQTGGQAPGYVQANLAVLPRDLAFEFLLFCQRNPKPCPVLEVTEVGSPAVPQFAPGADLRTDLPRYRVYRHGELVAEPIDIRSEWRDDLVGFLLGCSFSFETALGAAGVPLRSHQEGKLTPVYRTSRACVPAGPFHGPLVVSMRPIPADLVARAVQVTARFPGTHGAPVHVGDPSALGIADLDHPDWGEALTLHPGEVPVFWACGVTPQAVALTARPPLMLTHAPGHMFATDVRDDALAV
jgi:uncharacterized protein YcsI (UPF0317 family)